MIRLPLSVGNLTTIPLKPFRRSPRQGITFEGQIDQRSSLTRAIYSEPPPSNPSAVRHGRASLLKGKSDQNPSSPSGALSHSPTPHKAKCFAKLK
ncbi:hypothetical protein [Sphingobacterium bambusae]|uniref:Uncharacterized protein n=1 Tax=Sphingobacterium bambusae TaxID=662858 RepID=A0ABW6BMK0_9SPHI|nr:hypothetical protein [Sphingobacterium bambusae]WPL47882.1 hypothetical protein SCB77_18190 [Sphingobacterium bambusae]